MKTVIVNVPFDGEKFAAQYGLGPFDFSMAGNMLSFPDSLPDNPILEGPDAITFAPPGIHVHTMKKAEGKRGTKFILSAAESDCIHAVVDTEAQLNDPWLLSIPMEPGSSAYCKDTEKVWQWNGTVWKKS